MIYIIFGVTMNIVQNELW